MDFQLSTQLFFKYRLTYSTHALIDTICWAKKISAFSRIFLENLTKNHKTYQLGHEYRILNLPTLVF